MISREAGRQNYVTRPANTYHQSCLLASSTSGLDFYCFVFTVASSTTMNMEYSGSPHMPKTGRKSCQWNSSKILCWRIHNILPSPLWGLWREKNRTAEGGRSGVRLERWGTLWLDSLKFLEEALKPLLSVLHFQNPRSIMWI